MTTGPHSSQALSMASTPSYIVKQFIANLPDPQLEQENRVNCMVQVEVDEAILNGIVSGGSGEPSRQPSQQAPQQAPIKVLTRPVSSGKDPAAGFSFTKAKPTQQFDFRRPKQASGIPQPSELPHPSLGIPTGILSHQSSPPTGTTQAVQNVVEDAAYRGSSPKHHNPRAVEDYPSVPFTDATRQDSQAYKHPIPTTISGPIVLNFPSSRALPKGVSTAADSTVTDSNCNGTKEPALLNIIIPDRGKPTTVAPASIYSPTELIGVVDQPHVNKQNPSPKVSKDPLTSVAGVPKITKPRQRKTKLDPGRDGPPSRTVKADYTEEDLLRLLMYRRMQGQQELEYFKATEHQKESEIQQLRDLSNNLSRQLQEVIQRETQKTTELSKLKANKPIWEGKIKRLTDYVKGLTNDHKRLRDDADDLQKQHTDVLVTSKEFHNTLEDAQKLAERERNRSQRLEDDARHRIESLAQTVQYQHFKLQSDENLLTAEKERSNQLENQISRITASHEHLLQVFTGHRDSITGKIDKLLHQAKSITVPDKVSELHRNDPITPMLEQCIGMLQKLHESATVKPEDLGKLGQSIDSFVRGYVSLSTQLTHRSMLIRSQNYPFGRNLRGNLCLNRSRTEAACTSYARSTPGLERYHFF